MKFDIVCARSEDLARARWRETKETRYKAVAIDRYRVPRTAALVDPPRVFVTRQKNQSEIPRCLRPPRPPPPPPPSAPPSSGIRSRNRFFRVCTYRAPRAPFLSCSLTASRSIFPFRIFIALRDAETRQRIMQEDNRDAHTGPHYIQHCLLLMVGQVSLERRKHNGRRLG